MKFLLIKSNKTATLGLLAYLDMINHHNIVTKCAQCFLYLQNLQQNWKGPEHLYLNNCSSQVWQRTVLKNPLDFVSGVFNIIIHFAFSE